MVKKRRRKNKRIVVITLCFGIILSLIILVLIIITPHITINGKKNVEVLYNNEYNDEGAKATYLFKDISEKIKTTGSVDTTKLGEYRIDYSVKAGMFTKTATRKVMVVDKEAPVITLVGDTKVNACPNKKFKEIGFSAVDEYDGDLTNAVEVNEQDNKIVYTVKDSSGNVSTAERELERVDNENPVITLKGNSTLYVTLNNTYKDNGYTAIDNCDGDITDKVKVSGSVDTSKEGTYTIVYTVTDDNNNKVEVKRNVVVTRQVVKRSANMSCGEPGVIYLTFDDGPSSSTTPTILDILKKYNVNATFFVTNRSDDNLIKREYDEGHEIALHTASHDYAKVYASETAYFKDLDEVSARVERIIGKKATLIRFPGGSSNTVSRHYSTNIMSKLVDLVEQKGYTYFDWNVDSRDAEGKGSDDIYNYTIGGLSKSRGNVVLMHDIHRTTMNALERVIKTAKDQGYTFKTLDSSVKCWHRVNN